MTARRRARHHLIPRHDCPVITRHEARLHPRSSQRTPLWASGELTRRTRVQRGLDTCVQRGLDTWPWHVCASWSWHVSQRARSEWGKQRETEDGAGQLATYTKPMPSQTLHTREPLPLQTKHLLFPPIAMSKLPQPAPIVTLASVYMLRSGFACLCGASVTRAPSTHTRQHSRLS